MNNINPADGTDALDPEEYGRRLKAGDQILYLKEAAAFVRKPEGTMRYWRHLGIGPRSFRHGRNVAYWQTDLIVWRDTQASPAPFTCGQALSFYPLTQTMVTVYDMQEQPMAQAKQYFPPKPPTGPTISFGAATGRYHVGGATGLPVTARQGVFFLDLNNTTGTGPSRSPNSQQSFVTEIHLPNAIPGSARFGTGAKATPLDNVSMPSETFTYFPVYQP